MNYKNRIRQFRKATMLGVVLSTTIYSASYAQQNTPVSPPAKKETKQQITVQGVVWDAATKKVLAGVSVSVGNYSTAFTDDKGRFRLIAPDKNAVVTVANEGYHTKSVPVLPGSKMEIYLFADDYVSQYNQIRLPYATYSNARSPFAVTSVNLQGGWSTNAETPDTYLQGQVSGLNVVRRSGTPGIGANMFLRGYSSLAATNQPLVVVDGVIYDTGFYGSSIISGNVDNPLTFIDPKDIDNITVLKDGGTMYGTKGANGVVLISTIRAKDVATKIDFAAYGGINSPPANIPLMNASQYRVYLSDMLQSRGWSSSMIAMQPYMKDDQNEQYYVYHNDTDWQSKVLKSSVNQNYYLKVTGGDDIATYGLSVGYIDNKGIIDNTNSRKYHTRFNGDLKLGSKLNGNVSLSFMDNDQVLRNGGNAPQTNPIYLAAIKAPFLTTHEVNEQGVVSPNFADKDIFGIGNPMVATYDVVGKNRNYRFLGIAGLDYTFNPQWKLATTIGVTYNKTRENFFYPEKGLAHDSLSTAAIRNQSGTNVARLLQINSDTRLSFNKTFANRSSLSSNLGIRYSSSESESDFGYGFNSATDDLISVDQGVGALRQISGSLGSSRWLNTYFNVDYNLQNKYYLSFNAALDGSSRFGKDANGGLKISGNQFAFMPSLAGAWLLSSEDFLKDSKFVDLLKVRASYSVAGNDDIGNYTARRYYVSQNLLGMQGLIVGNIGNTGLKWESVHKANIGFDLAVLRERLNISFDAYSNVTKDMISWQDIATEAGLKQVLTNGGEMTAKGFELSVNGRLINSAFKWDMGLSIAKYKNKVTALPGNSMISSFGGATFITQVGSAPNLFYGYRTAGVFAGAEQAAQANQFTTLASGEVRQYAAGDVFFQNNFDDAEDVAEGRKYINDKDRVVIGNPNPDFTGTVTNTFKWQGFTLNALFTFSSGNDVYNGPRSMYERQSGIENQTVAVLNRWRSEGQQTATPKLAWGDPMGNSRFSDRWIEDGSYFRLRTLNLSYDLQFKKPKLFKYMTLYVSSNNLFTLTKYKGYDPEFSAGPGIYAQGVDTGLQPLYKSTQLGIRVGL